MIKMTRKISDSRALACFILLSIVKEGKSFHPKMTNSLFPHLDERNTGFINHLCFGVLRFYHRLEGWLNLLVKTPLKEKDLDLKLLLMVGLYQLFYTDTPQYAAVHTTVNACQSLGKAWAQKLINGVLREALRQEKNLTLFDSIAIKTAHPDWLIKALIRSWPTQWEAIVNANLTHPPLTIRVNAAKISKENYCQQLKNENIAADLIEHCPSGLIIKEACAVEKLPGFTEGWFSVQDGAAQLAAYLLDLKPQQKVLDACAAPGGKTAHLLELENKLHSLLAIEKDPQRLPLIKNTLSRLGLENLVSILCEDATCPENWWDQQLFDRILLDVPCSATGVIRRHPDIKLLRQPEQIALLAKQQTMLLDKIWPLLKPNGILVYATCSLLPQENCEQIIRFLQSHPDAKEIPIGEEWGIAQPVGRQILPGQHNMDGFYYARLSKQC